MKWTWRIPLVKRFVNLRHLPGQWSGNGIELRNVFLVWDGWWQMTEVIGGGLTWEFIMSRVFFFFFFPLGVRRAVEHCRNLSQYLVSLWMTGYMWCPSALCDGRGKDASGWVVRRWNDLDLKNNISPRSEGTSGGKILLPWPWVSPEKLSSSLPSQGRVPEISLCSHIWVLDLLKKTRSINSRPFSLVISHAIPLK